MQSLHRSTHQLDLSYLHRAKEDTLLEAIRGTVGCEDDVHIDLSSSLLGKSMMGKLVESLQGSSASTIQLSARNNQLSPVDVTVFLEAIIGSEDKSKSNSTQSGEETPASSNTTTTTTTTTEDGNATTIDTDSSTHNESFPVISAIDFGGNDFGQDVSGSKKFLTALKKLLANHLRCPNTIRFDICGLSPVACRSLSKVSKKKPFRLCTCLLAFV